MRVVLSAVENVVSPLTLSRHATTSARFVSDSEHSAVLPPSPWGSVTSLMGDSHKEEGCTYCGWPSLERIALATLCFLDS